MNNLRTSSPFHPDNNDAYRAWRDRKLRNYPTHLTDLIVTVKDPRAPTPAEHAAIIERCRQTNMALYVSGLGADPDKEISRAFGRNFGLEQLDCNLMADDDGLTSLTVAKDGPRQHFIPYTNRPIKWHTDGYYNTMARQIRGLQLYCVSPAASGGESALMDHEIAYILMRDANPDFIRVFMQPGTMTIPARTDDNGVARAEQTGPVFSILPDSGSLHMRYTARTRSIAWRQDALTQQAVAFLEHLLNTPSPYIFRGHLESGMGLICNNVLHDRSGFTDDTRQRRLIYRARYFDRIHGTGLNDV